MRECKKRKWVLIVLILSSLLTIIRATILITLWASALISGESGTLKRPK